MSWLGMANSSTLDSVDATSEDGTSASAASDPTPVDDAARD
ncbi:MAG TPA: hypothetical protein PLI18_08070 [Pirellulaceae bacterium]|nr:hypothetical protein [Pirellulaceae bacterium]